VRIRFDALNVVDDLIQRGGHQLKSLVELRAAYMPDAAWAEAESSS
jgi:hypothetical protein